MACKDPKKKGSCEPKDPKKDSKACDPKKKACGKPKK